MTAERGSASSRMAAGRVEDTIAAEQRREAAADARDWDRVRAWALQVADLFLRVPA